MAAAGRWTDAETAALREAMAKHGTAGWAQVAGAVKTRTLVQCRDRWRRITDDAPRRLFDAAEDALLLECHKAVSNNKGTVSHGHWKKVASRMGNGRTSRQCRDRYIHSLKHGRQPWSLTDDATLIGHVETMGRKWAAIGREMGRSDNDCKNRWNGALRRRREGGAGKAVTPTRPDRAVKLPPPPRKRRHRRRVPEALPVIGAAPPAPPSPKVEPPPKVEPVVFDAALPMVPDIDALFSFTDDPMWWVIPET